jgi:glycosyltransferase involved in cell wall biosynthesis
MVRRDVFDAVNGFDERLAIVGNDVDLCLRIAGTSQRILIEPASQLIHRESESRRGVDHLRDEDRVWDRWADILVAGDPHYNVNLAERHVDARLSWERVAGRIARRHGDRSAGVNLVGYIQAEMGVGEAARADAMALTAADIPFVVLDQRLGTPARQEDHTWEHAITTAPAYDTNILHINADLLPQALRQLPPGLIKGRRNIGYWTWELPAFPAEWQPSFALIDEVWVPSTFVQQAVGALAPVPVRVVPHAIRTPQGPFLARSHLGLPEGTLQFLVMYDTQSVIERKNPEGAIDAFMRAFDGLRDDVTLVVKVNSAGDRELSRLRARIGERNDVIVLSHVLSRHETDSIIASSDIFVSLHRSEGFGLAIAEAMALGKAVIATGWSGNMDFMSRDTAACVRYRLVTLERSYGPYPAGQHWAEPDVDEAAEWMRTLADDHELRTRLGTAAATRIRRTSSPATVGSLMAGYLSGKSYP